MYFEYLCLVRFLCVLLSELVVYKCVCGLVDMVDLECCVLVLLCDVMFLGWV